MHDTITGPVFQEMLIFGAASIAKEKQSINDLNVFPVPDGDTGTNMSLTMHAAAQELQKRSPATVDLASSITASALLRGARGNSGVILSLLFRGMSKSLKGCVTADGCTFAAAMQEGVSAAYNAVMKPAEGTILTVSRLGAQAAVDFAKDSTDFEGMLDALLAAAREALAGILANYRGWRRCEIILVFDAYKVKGNPGSMEKKNGIYIVYTKEAQLSLIHI